MSEISYRIVILTVTMFRLHSYFLDPFFCPIVTALLEKTSFACQPNACRSNGFRPKDVAPCFDRHFVNLYILRPYPMATAGTPHQLHFDVFTKVFNYQVEFSSTFICPSLFKGKAAALAVSTMFAVGAAVTAVATLAPEAPMAAIDALATMAAGVLWKLLQLWQMW
jgi:hypothetical protein